MQTIAIIIIIGFLLSPIVDIVLVNKLYKQKQQNAELQQKLNRKEIDEACK